MRKRRKITLKELRDIVRQSINEVCGLLNIDESFSRNQSDYYTQDQLDRLSKIRSKGKRLNAAYKEKGPIIMDELPPMKDPKVVGKAYKAFTIENNMLYPVMVDNYEKNDTDASKVVRVPTVVGKWVPAQVGKCVVDPMTGERYVKQSGGGFLSFRPGWHLGLLPYATQFNKKKYGVVDDPNKLIYRKDGSVGKIGKYFPSHIVFAEVEYAIDDDLTDIMKADKLKNGFAELPTSKIRDEYNDRNGISHGKREMSPASYRYWTNTIDASGEWVITSMMRVIRVLTPSEVDNIISRHTVGDAIDAARRKLPQYKDRLNDKLKPQLREPGYPTDDDIRKTNSFLRDKYNLDYDPNDMSSTGSGPR